MLYRRIKIISIIKITKNRHSHVKLIAAGFVCLVSMVFITRLCVTDVECERTGVVAVVTFPAVCKKHRLFADYSTLK